MAHQTLRYVPALSVHRLASVYDPLLRWGMRDQVFKSALIRRAGIQPRQRVLDLGCGTGTLTLMLKRAVPTALVTGVDPDPEILLIARAKASQGGLSISWDQGLAGDLPYPDGHFDKVVSSLAIHHLANPDKLRAFQEVHRVLRLGGSFHIIDFGPPLGIFTRLQAAIMRNLEHAQDNFAGRIPIMLGEAGFTGITVTEPMNTVFAPIWFYDALRQKG